MPLSPRAKDRLRLVLAAIGMAVVAIPVIVAAAWLFPRQSHVNWKWARFIVVTIFLVVFSVKTYWRARAHPGFWGLLLGILVVHFVCVGYFFYTGPGLPLLVFGPTVGLEFGLMALAIYRFLGIGPSASPPARKIDGK